MKRATFFLVALFALPAFADVAPTDTPATADAPTDPVDADPNAPTVAASISKTEGHVGDRFILTINAVAKKGYAVSLPPAQDLGKFELIDRTEGDHEGRDLGNGRRSFQFVLQITAFELGTLQVPAMRLTYLNPKGETHAALTTPIDVRILSLVTEGEKAELQKERPPRAVWIEDRRVLVVLKWAGAALAALIIFALILRAVRRARRRHESVQAAEVVDPRSPEEIAIEKLQQIRAAAGFELEGYRPFSFAVAEVVRAFVGAQYGFDSLEMTTTELIAALHNVCPAIITSGSTLENFLGETDLIKFAKTGATPAQANALLDAAQAIILNAPKPTPPPAPTSPGAPDETPQGNAA